MQRRFMTFAALCIAMAITGCSKQSTKNVPVSPPAKHQDEQDAPAWKLTLKSSCGETAAAECVAGYGFSVDANNRYKIGPGPQGQVKAGSLTDEEFKTIEGQISQLVAAPSANAEICNAATEVSGNADELLLARGGTEQSIVKLSADGNICFKTTTQEEAEKLHKAIRELADKYYPQPFPDACLDAADELEALFPSLQACATDSDCAYVNERYETISPRSVEWVYTDACIVLKPMVAANASALNANLAKVQSAVDHAREVCGGRIYRTDCGGTTGFQSTDAAPVCQQGFCRANPSVISLF